VAGPLHERWEAEAVAYMSLHDIDDLVGALREAGRVLEPGGRLCAAVVHPASSAHLGSDDEVPYFEERHYTDVVERGGLEMAFHGIHRPLRAYSRRCAAPACWSSASASRRRPTSTSAPFRTWPRRCVARRSCSSSRSDCERARLREFRAPC
jgi:SAM-dependent methyltransferase